MHSLHKQEYIQMLFFILVSIIQVGSKSIVHDEKATIDRNYLQNNGIPLRRVRQTSLTRTISIIFLPIELSERFSESLIDVSTPSTKGQSTSTTDRQSSTTKSTMDRDLNAFSVSLKRAAIILAAIAVGLGVIRFCLLFCKSPSNRSHIRSASIQPQAFSRTATAFKPDLPPEYAQAVALKDTSTNELPAYADLPVGHRQAYTIFIPIHNETTPRET
jgi:hypothetical protein